MATIDNSSVITFPTPTGQWQQPTHYALHPGSTGWDPWATDVLSPRPTRPDDNDTVEIAAAGLYITILASNGVTNAMLELMLVSLSLGVRYVSLHTASPTASNELTSGSSPGYARASTGNIG